MAAKKSKKGSKKGRAVTTKGTGSTSRRSTKPERGRAKAAATGPAKAPKTGRRKALKPPVSKGFKAGNREALAVRSTKARKAVRPKALKAVKASTPKRTAANRATAKKKVVGKSKALSQGKAAASRTKMAAASRPTRAAARTTPKAMATAPKRAPMRRRDALGHLDPKYAADLLRQSGRRDREDDATSFVARPRSDDDLAEHLGEDFVAAATSGENGGEDVLDQVVPEEMGGPFVESTAGAEFAEGTDPSNPKDAKREPFPTT